MVIKYFENYYGNKKQKEHIATQIVGKNEKQIEEYIKDCHESYVGEDTEKIYDIFSELNRDTFEQILKTEGKKIFKPDLIIDEENGIISSDWYLS